MSVQGLPNTDNIDWQNMPPAHLRQAFRRGAPPAPTGALAPGFVQANIAIVPSCVADDLHQFLQANPAACPFLARSEPGDPSLPTLGQGIDIRTDLPLYRVFHNGRADAMPTDIIDHWQDDFVTFAIGCSLSFEADLVSTGIKLRSYGPDVTCSAFDTNLPTQPAGPFAGNLVVSMRAIQSTQVDRVIELTLSHPQAHGAPIHIGSPDDIGVDMTKPVDGIGLTDIRADETPVFWACGVTLERALQIAALPVAITHAPAHMLITDRHAHRQES